MKYLHFWPMALLAASLAQAQQTSLNSDAGTGAIDGTVVDLQDQPIPNARVYATWRNNSPDARMRVEVLTNELGQFHLPSVPAGTATVHAWKSQGWVS